ncbi:MAG: SPOR domain-containing protein [Zoogloeaceae bacterium]|jgi:cell division protein FtsN|nr:SPOR domain-containing protein [Zoogloeaceae bacterium]
MATDRDDAEQRGKLIRQLMYAASAVGVLLALLVLFNTLSTPEARDSPSYPNPVPVSRPAGGTVQPLTPPALPPEATLPDIAPSLLPQPASTLPPAPENMPVQPAQTTPAPAQIQPPVLAPTVPPATAVQQPTQAQTPHPTQSSQPAASTAIPSATVIATTPAPQPQRPIAAPTQPQPPRQATILPLPKSAPKVEDVPEGSAPPTFDLPTLPPDPMPPPASGFLVQAGVFSNPQRAEDLYAKLRANGIPATLETRVHIGPFKSQSEAQAARARLKKLGIEGLILPPR